MPFSNAAIANLRRSFGRIRFSVPYRYAQWLTEEPETGDYKVVASDDPPGSESFDIAHRTGVIGHVFRTTAPIWIGNTKRSPLYDPFDDRVAWELTIPAFGPSGRLAVLNLEGEGRLAHAKATWRNIVREIWTVTGLRAPASFPQSGKIPWLDTRVFHAQPGASRKDAAVILHLAKALAAREEWVVLIGNLPVKQRSGYPTYVEAKARGVSTTACVRPFSPKVDILPIGDLGSKTHTDYMRHCRTLVRGRYHWAITIGESKEEIPIIGRQSKSGER